MRHGCMGVPWVRVGVRGCAMGARGHAVGCVDMPWVQMGVPWVRIGMRGCICVKPCPVLVPSDRAAT